MTHSVWFSFDGRRPERFDFATPAELNAFVKGVEAFGKCCDDFFDYEQFNTEEEAGEWNGGEG